MMLNGSSRLMLHTPRKISFLRCSIYCTEQPVWDSSIELMLSCVAPLWSEEKQYGFPVWVNTNHPKLRQISQQRLPCHSPHSRNVQPQGSSEILLLPSMIWLKNSPWTIEAALQHAAASASIRSETIGTTARTHYVA